MLDALELPPKSADPLFWTDFIELKALIHPDRCYSRGDLMALLKRTRDTATDRSDHADHGESRWRDVTGFCQTRIAEFDDTYPFRVSEDGDTIELIDDITSEQAAYLSLLLSALMRHVPKKRYGEVARFFELVSQVVFCQLMPEGAEVHPTWAHGGPQAHYKGTLFEKMKQVAGDIRCTANFEERDFKANDTGDGGIDIVAWHPMADAREGIPVAFAQCGCSKDDWKFKQLEASPAKHRRNLPAMHPWATYYFMPLDLRHPDGDWAYKSDIVETIIVDRLRLLRLSRQYDLFGQWPPLPLLKEVMALACA